MSTPRESPYDFGDGNPRDFGDVMPGLGDQRRYYAAAEATKEPPAGPETPVGWELVQVHATQRAEQSKKRKPFKLQNTQVLPSADGPIPRGAG